MFSLPEITVILKFLDYSDSEVTKDLHFPLSLGSLTMKSHWATQPTECPHLTLSSQRHSINTQLALPLTLASAVFFPVFPTLSSLLTSWRYLLTPFSTFNLFVPTFSHTQWRDLLPRVSKFPHTWCLVPKISFVLSGDEHAERTDCLSSHSKKKNNWNLKQN